MNKNINTHLNVGFFTVVLFCLLSMGILFSVYFEKTTKENVTARLEIAIQTAWDKIRFQDAKVESLLMQTIQYNDLEDLLSRRDYSQMDALLKKISEPYGDLGYFLITDQDGEILSSSDHPAGERWYLAYLLDYLVEEKKPIASREYLPTEAVRASKRAFQEKARVVSLDNPNGEIALNGAMLNIVVAPIFDENQRLIGSLVGGSLLNNDHELAESYTQGVPETYLSIAIEGLRICSNIAVDDFRFLEGSIQENPLIQTTQAGLRYRGEIYLQGRPALIVVDPVFNHRGDVIGNMGVGSPMFVIPELNNSYLLLIALFSMMIFFVSIFVVRIITGLITTPIYKLQGLAKAVAANEVNVKEVNWQVKYAPVELVELAENILQMAQNLTREKLLLEEKVNERTKQLAATVNELETANKYKSQFLANISHELRTPLSSIISFAVLLQDKLFGELNPKQEEYVAIIIDSGNHLLDLINDILDVIKLDNKIERVNPTPVEVKPLIRDVITLLYPQLRSKGLDFHLDIAENLPKPVWDEKKIRQIMINLLSNAIKFTAEGGVIEIEARRAVEFNNMIEIIVMDTGIGIAPELKEKVFLAFEHADASYTQIYKGVGLGLAICKALVELHGGWIWLEDNPKGGTLACVRLPVDPFCTTSSEGQASE